MGEVNVFFKEKDDDKLVQLPVVPEEVKLTVDGNMETVNIINLGEVNIARHPKGVELSFDSFFPRDVNLPLVQTKGNFWQPTEYIEYFNGVMSRQNPVLVTITGFPEFSVDMLVSNFDYNWEGGSNDCSYTLDLVRYTEIRIQTIPLVKRYEKPKPKPANNKKSASATSKQVTPGCEVILNGRVHRDSYGRGPGKTFKDYHGKVNFVKTDGRSHPYHVTTMGGGWLGWVVPGAVTVV